MFINYWYSATFQLLPVHSINSSNFIFSSFKSDHLPLTSKYNYIIFKVKHTQNHMGMFCITILLYLKTISEILVFISIVLIFNSDYFPRVTCSFIWSLSGLTTHTYKHRMIALQCAQKHRSLSLEQEYIIIRALLFLTVTVYHLFAQDSN